MYKDTDEYYAKVLSEAGELLSQAVSLSAKLLEMQSDKKRKREDSALLMVFNSLSWQRKEIVEVPLEQISELKPLQKSADGKRALCRVDAVGMGMSVSSAKVEERDFEREKSNFCSVRVEEGTFVLENSFLVARFSGEALLTSLLHKESGRQVVQSDCAANSFLLYDDLNLFWVCTHF